MHTLMRWFIVGILFVASTTFGKYTLPRYYQNLAYPQQPDKVLAHIFVEVNGDPRIIKNGETHGFIRGDKIVIRRAVLEGAEQTPSYVNLVGFKKSGGGYLDDTGVEIDTSSSLSSVQSRWTVDEAGQVFAVVVSSPGVLHGSVFLKRYDPKIRYVDVKINGLIRVMREGEPLVVSEKDAFKVAKIVTNLESNSDVAVRIVPFKKKPFQHIRPAQYYEMQFVRKKFTFGRIPLVVEKL